MHRTIAVLTCVVAHCLLSNLAGAATISTVYVGDAGNVADKDYGSGQFGSVAYDFMIGAYEVTNSQYAEFLNAKAASDPLGLYNSNMGTSARGGITRNGSSGSYSYEVRPNMGDKPVNFVSFYDAARFTNWLHNGQGSGDTETGAYTLLGGTATPSNGTTVTRNADAVWFLPSENEWYKAAYFDPRTHAQGGPAGDDHYWLHATAADTSPAYATADAIGNINNPGVNVVNYNLRADWNGQDGNVTTVGSAGPLSTSYYGTYDQAGNLWEWNESIFGIGTSRGLRGGTWLSHATEISAATRHSNSATIENQLIGFRVATVVAPVPEPSSMVLGSLAAAVVSLGCWRRRRRAGQ